jgi:DNA-binding IclR family transcriptional regulator
MESTRPIRALLRGLDALTMLNSRDGATVSEVAHDIRLPRTTAYRILETLCDAGFTVRDTADDRYRPTIRVHGLSEGFDDDAWVSQIAKPCIDELCREIVWPVSLSTLAGTAMMVRETTDHDTPLATLRGSAGLREPLLASAAGLAYLAFCSNAERDNLLDLLAGSSNEVDRAARVRRHDLLSSLADIKNQGYATHSSRHAQLRKADLRKSDILNQGYTAHSPRHDQPPEADIDNQGYATRARRLVDEVTVGAPVTVHDRVLAVLCIRVAASVVPLKSDVERLLPKLGQCAARISTLYEDHQARARPRSTPGAAA